MYFVPLTQIESVELLIHSLKAAGGAADCSQCPASKVCMKQCLTIAGSVEKLLQEGALPQLAAEPSPTAATENPPPPEKGGPGGKGKLRVVK